MFSIGMKKVSFGRRDIFSRFENWKWQDWIRSTCKWLLLFMGIGYLFYGNILVGLLGVPFLLFVLKEEYEMEQKKRRQRIGLAFREALQAMSAAMHAGYAAENAIRESIRDLVAVYGEQAEIVQEFRRMWNEIRMQIPVEQVWDNFGERSKVPVIREFAVIFRTAKRSGGDLTAIMDHTASAIGERLQVQQEIETILAAKRLEWKVMTVIPFGIILYMKLTFPEFMGRMYGDPVGVVVMSAALGIFLIARRMGERILETEWR